MTQLRLRSGGQLLVDQLLIHGADMAFCVPGESYLEVLDALHDAAPRLKLINARHEAGAANMAEAYGKLTGRPGICLVTRGPGACHASVGVHTAFQDSSPMILLVGQVGRDMMDREAFQEIDYRQMFGPVAKWAAQIDRTERIPEYIARAFHVAMSGRPGPVVLALPEDMLTERVAVLDAEPAAVVAPSVNPAELPKLRKMLERAERPLLLIGGPNWTDAACKQIVAFAEANNIPASCSFRRQDAFDNTSRVYAGDLGTSGPPALIKRAKDADLLIVVGARLGEMTTQGYTIMDSPEPRQKLIHVHADPDELGRVYRPTLGIQGTSESFAALAATMAPVEGKRWAAWTEKARADYLATLEPTPYNGALDVGRALADLRDKLPADMIVTVDAGNHSGWPQRYLSYRRPGRQIGPTSGAMAYSVPAAVAAKLVHPERLVLAFVGDGGFMMCGQEMSTAAQYGANVICVVTNNRMYGTIRMHQEREHPTRVVGTDLANPDFAAFGRVLGCHGETVTRTEQFAAALERAIKSNKPAVIELQTDPNLVTTRTTITALREAALARAKQDA
ncbi:MAG TPA: thiamine pyrophosphate-binding protein [Alphaproteobacteria bacterium]|nr:thiamine pyrophosphate-binding protein [Alphaproteobacteria bacterium]